MHHLLFRSFSVKFYFPSPFMLSIYAVMQINYSFFFLFAALVLLSLTLYDFEISLLMLDADINMLLCAFNNFSHKIPIKQQVKINLVLSRWHVGIKLGKKMDRYDPNYIFIISTYDPINSGMFLTMTIFFFLIFCGFLQ